MEQEASDGDPGGAVGGQGEDPEEGQRPIQRTVPEAPSPAEVEEHELTHIPYRPWCRHCRAARGRSDVHRRTTREEQLEDESASTSVWSVDYTYCTTDGHMNEHDNEGEILRHRRKGHWGSRCSRRTTGKPKPDYYTSVRSKARRTSTSWTGLCVMSRMLGTGASDWY